jgi:hypothetical protein
VRALRFAALGAWAVLAAAVAVIGGWPDPGRAVDLLSGRIVTPSTEASLVALLCWIGVASLALFAVRTLRPHRPGFARRARLPSLAVLVIGTALLAGGIAHRSGYHVCCADPITAQQAAHLVH